MKVLRAWPGAKDKDQKIYFFFVCLFTHLFIYALNKYLLNLSLG